LEIYGNFGYLWQLILQYLPLNFYKKSCETYSRHLTLVKIVTIDKKLTAFFHRNLALVFCAIISASTGGSVFSSNPSSVLSGVRSLEEQIAELSAMDAIYSANLSKVSLSTFSSTSSIFSTETCSENFDDSEHSDSRLRRRFFRSDPLLYHKF